MEKSISPRPACGPARSMFRIAALASVVACGPDLAAPGTASDAISGDAAANQDRRTITLITGDRVTVDGATGARAVHVEPGPGRAAIGHATVRRGDDVLVIPHDVAQLVAGGQLDRALFNVTRLLADGYGDRDRADLPLILTGVAGAMTPALAAPGVVARRPIPALHALAIRQPKASPGAALTMLRSARTLAAASLAAGTLPKLWLDRRYKPVLDHSVPQIGGPAAWARGYTGAGVTVAVLDTGIDAGHPDFAGKVVDARSFVDDDLGTGDSFGHGTHVASILAGTGAASGGLYRGVAPDAQLINARVCSQFCEGSAILDAMAWAVIEKRAPIVNLSIGGFDDPELDPLEDAVNQLSAQYGTLFVIAAGNDGEFGERTIDSPGSAEAALTVGAVDRDDQLAVFSGRGPTAAGGVIKPEVTAPGVGIVAARAAGVDPIGEPVGEAYQRVSGTSMATPHVAGAAAILLQQHPKWTGAELKAALIDAAKPDPALTAFEQGTGRVDVDRATRQQLIGQPATMDFGLARWPHTDDPIQRRTLTYRNEGAAPITLALTASLSTADHRAAPPAMIQIAPSSLTIAPGATADATVRIDTNGDAPDVRYTGSVVASAGDTRLLAAVAVEREVESYDLRLHQLDLAGQDASSLVILATRSPLGLFAFLEVDGTLTLRLPRDTYSLHSFPSEPVFLVYPNLVLDHDTAVELDNRLARPVVVDVPGVALTFGQVGAMSWDVPGHLEIDSVDEGLLTAHLGPELPADEYRAWVQAAAVPVGSGPIEPPVGSFPGVADLYGFAHQERGHFVTGWRATIARRQLATVDSVSVGEPREQFRKFLSTAPSGTIDPPQLIFDPSDYGPGVHRTEHLFASDLAWVSSVIQIDTVNGFGFAVNDLSAMRVYEPGKRYVERFNDAPCGPALADIHGAPAAARQGDVLTISPSMFSDRALPSRMNSSAAFRQRSTLFRNGAVFVDHDNFHEVFFPPVRVPPGAASYRFEADSERGPSLVGGPPVFDLSTHVTASWTFASQHEPGTAPRILPLPTLRFVPELDDRGRARHAVMVLPAVVERPPGAATPRITRATVDVSFDDGVTWARVPGVVLGDRWFGIVANPPGAAFASLRGAVEDVDGRRSDLTIIHAYRAH